MINKIASPTIFITPEGDTYQVHPLNHSVTLVPRGTNTPIIVAGGNGPGSSANQLYFPIGLHVVEDGTIYVADSHNDRIQVWYPGSAEGDTVIGSDQLNWPTDVYVDENDDILVTDKFNSRIQKWTAIADAILISDNNTYSYSTNQLYPSGSQIDVYGNTLIYHDEVRHIHEVAQVTQVS